MRIGIIGLGRLGSALARGLSLHPGAGPVLVHNRTEEKARELVARCPGLELCLDAREVFSRCGLVFLWTNAADATGLLDGNAAAIRRASPLLVSCTLDVPLARFTDRWAECLPNVNMAAGKGVTPIHFAPVLAAADRELIASVLGRVGSIHEVSREDLPFFSALASCGPALYATIMEAMADLMAERRGYDRDLCRRMVRETVLGTVLLQELDGIDAAAVTERVAHPGGPTEAGVRHLRSALPPLMTDMLRAMRKW